MSPSGNRVLGSIRQMPLKGLAECLALHLFKGLELAQRTTIPPGLDFTAKLDSVTQKGI